MMRRGTGKRVRKSRESESVAGGGESVDVGGEPESPRVTQEQRSDPSARVRRELSRALGQRLNESPTQAAVTTSGLLTPNSRQLTRARTGNVDDSLRCGELSSFFKYELCNFSNSENENDSTSACQKELETRTDIGTYLQDAANQRRHAICLYCGAVFHSRCTQTYYVHKNERCKVLHNREQQDTQSNVVKCVDFINEGLPCLAAKSSMSTGAFLSFVRSYEEIRPNSPPAEILPHLPCPKTFHVKEKIVASKLWETIRATVKQHSFFGLAVDGGINNVKHQHIVVSVMYVGESSFVLPLVYHKRKKAFSGAEMSAHLMTMLRGGLGDDVLKLRYLMVDGCAVNHVARAATEEALKQFYERYEEVGTLQTKSICVTGCVLLFHAFVSFLASVT